jgi:phosphinothricin acetyltransferase
MLIRPATPADVPAITAIYNHAVLTSTVSFDLEPKSLEDRARWLAERDARHPVIVAEEGDVVGWAGLSRMSDRKAWDGTAEIAVYVDEAHRREGIGRALTQALLDQAPSLGMHVILARICTENTGSIEMMRRLGFAEAGTVHEVGYKFGRWLDVVTWEHVFREHSE